MSDSPDRVLTAMKALFGALTTIMALLSQTLIREDLIPEQIKFIGSIGALFILVSLLVTLGYTSYIRKYLAVWLIVAFSTLTLLALLQIRYVITLENFGSPVGTYKFLIGSRVTGDGNRMREALGRNRSEAEFIADMGVDRIPVAYGTSYYVNAITYALGYIIFVCAVVLALGSIIIRSGAST